MYRRNGRKSGKIKFNGINDIIKENRTYVTNILEKINNLETKESVENIKKK